MFQVSLGKAHIVALTRSGEVYTFGMNHKGQCGRDFPSGGAGAPGVAPAGNNAAFGGSTASAKDSAASAASAAAAAANAAANNAFNNAAAAAAAMPHAGGAASALAAAEIGGGGGAVGGSSVIVGGDLADDINSDQDIDGDQKGKIALCYYAI